MNEQKAREILGDSIRPDGGLFEGGQYMEWSVGDENIVLDARFSADELEAIVWWMRNALRRGDERG